MATPTDASTPRTDCSITRASLKAGISTLTSPSHAGGGGGPALACARARSASAASTTARVMPSAIATMNSTPKASCVASSAVNTPASARTASALARRSRAG